MKIKDSVKNYLSGSTDNFEEKVEVSSVQPSNNEEVVDQIKVDTLKEYPCHEPSSSNAHEQEASLFESIFTSLVSDEWVEEGLQNYTSPTYRLTAPDSGGHHWLVDYTTKMMTPVNPSLEVVPLQALEEELFLCQIGDAHYIVTGSIIQHVGYN
tara:strand:- start:121 stop:582 length:462 start_codon:yes stop_codon:yes gene_type:complete